MTYRKYQNHLSVKFGGVCGESYMFRISFHKTSPRLRVCICFNTNELIRFFGFNQKDINAF